MCNKCVINEYFGSFYRSSSLISFSCMTSYSRMPLHLFICTCFTIMYPFKNPFYSRIIIQNYSSNLHTQCFVYTTQVSKPHMSNTGEVFQNLSSENLKRMTAYIKKKKSKCCTNFHFQWILVSCEWGWKYSTFCIPLVHITCTCMLLHSAFCLYRRETED